MQRTLVLLAAILGASVVAYFLYDMKRREDHKCDAIFQQTATSLETKLGVIRANGSVIVGEKAIQDLTERAQIVGLNLKACCIVLPDGRLDTEQFIRCKRGADEYDEKLGQVSTALTEAQAAPDRVEEQREAALAALATAQAISSELLRQLATLNTRVPDPGESVTRATPPPPAPLASATNRDEVGSNEHRPSPASTNGIVEKTPSSEPRAPTLLAPGEVVKGRLPDSSQGISHYWRLQMPPGRYNVIFELARADGQFSNIQARLSPYAPDGHNLGAPLNVNEIYDRFRAIGRIDTSQLGNDIILRVQNETSIVDYWLGVFPAGSKGIAVPFFARTPTVHPIELGTPVSFAIGGNQRSMFEAYYELDLQGADYLLSVELHRIDNRPSNVQGSVDVIGRLGYMLNGRACTINVIDVSGKCTTKVSLAEPEHVIVRVRAENNAAYNVVLGVERWPEE